MHKISRNRNGISSLLVLMLFSACASQSADINRSEPARPNPGVGAGLGTTMHDNELWFAGDYETRFSVQGLNLIRVDASLPADPNARKAMNHARGQYDCINTDPPLGFTTEGQAPSDPDFYPTCLDQIDVTHRSENETIHDFITQHVALIVRAGRSGSEATANRWMTVVKAFHEDKDNATQNRATPAINTHIEAFKNAQNQLVNGFGKKLNFFLLADLDFVFYSRASRTNVTVNCPNVLVGQQGDHPIKSHLFTTSVKSQSEDAGEAAGKMAWQLYRDGMSDAFPELLLAQEISSELEDWAISKFMVDNTWWLAQLNSDIDNRLQGFVSPIRDASSSGPDDPVHELALSCTSGVDSMLVVVRPTRKNDDFYKDRDDTFMIRLVDVKSLLKKH